MTHRKQLSVAVLLSVAAASPIVACHDGSPLILDLRGDGLLTSHLDSAVSFDLDGDGVAEWLAWTRGESDEAFLALDLDGDGRITNGRELFGNATLLSTGDKAKNGFLALAQWDQPDMGGDGNGYIDGYDLIWNSLLLWVDANHDGVSQVEELSSLSRYHLLSLSLVYEEVEGRDSNGNAHRFQSTFERLVQRRWGSAYVKSGAFHDVYFRIRHEDDAP